MPAVTKATVKMGVYQRASMSEGPISDEEFDKLINAASLVEEEKKSGGQGEVKMSRDVFYRLSRVGTLEHSFMKIAQEISASYAIQTLNDYVQLFFYEK